VLASKERERGSTGATRVGCHGAGVPAFLFEWKVRRGPYVRGYVRTLRTWVRAPTYPGSDRPSRPLPTPREYRERPSDESSSAGAWRRARDHAAAGNPPPAARCHRRAASSGRAASPNPPRAHASPRTARGQGPPFVLRWYLYMEYMSKWDGRICAPDHLNLLRHTHTSKKEVLISPPGGLCSEISPRFTSEKPEHPPRGSQISLVRPSRAPVPSTLARVPRGGSCVYLTSAPRARSANS
jgi:hypothetical protein